MTIKSSSNYLAKCCLKFFSHSRNSLKKKTSTSLSHAADSTNEIVILIISTLVDNSQPCPNCALFSRDHFNSQQLWRKNIQLTYFSDKTLNLLFVSRRWLSFHVMPHGLLPYKKGLKVFITQLKLTSNRRLLFKCGRTKLSCVNF